MCLETFVEATLCMCHHYISHSYFVFFATVYSIEVTVCSVTQSQPSETDDSYGLAIISNFTCKFT